jgi:uncharacterized protein (DUF1015 family)
MRVFPIITLLPDREQVQKIASLGSGKLNSEVLQSKAMALEDSYLRVVKPQFIDSTLISETQDFYDKSRFYYDELLKNKRIIPCDSAMFYYQQTHHTGVTLGGWIFGIDAEEYLNGNIKKHENTLTSKENRLVKHIAALESMAEPVLLSQTLTPVLRSLSEEITQHGSFLSMSDEFLNKHEIWKIENPDSIEMITHEFEKMDSLYIADGHHRCAASSRYLIERFGKQSGKGIMSLIVDENALLIKPFYRMLSRVSANDLWDFLEENRISHRELEHSISFEDLKKGQILCITQNKMCIIEISPDLKGNTALSTLDVTILESKILKPIYKIQDSATDERLSFLRGDTPLDHIKSLLQEKVIEVAFLFAPNSMDEIRLVADEGSIMPPKSTFIEPKIPTGFIIEDYK